MSFHTDGTHVYLPSGTVWPGVVDPTLRKAYDVAIPGGKRINLADYGTDDAWLSMPNQGEPTDQSRFASKLGDSHLFENDRILSKHMYNPKEESVPNTKHLSVRDWRRG